MHCPIDRTERDRALYCPLEPPQPCPLSPRIDKKMSDARGSYKLDEAQAVLRETKAIKKAITCGEREKQDLIKVGYGVWVGTPSHFS